MNLFKGFREESRYLIGILDFCFVVVLYELGVRFVYLIFFGV